MSRHGRLRYHQGSSADRRDSERDRRRARRDQRDRDYIEYIAGRDADDDVDTDLDPHGVQRDGGSWSV